MAVLMQSDAAHLMEAILGGASRWDDTDFGPCAPHVLSLSGGELVAGMATLLSGRGPSPDAVMSLLATLQKVLWVAATAALNATIAQLICCKLAPIANESVSQAQIGWLLAIAKFVCGSTRPGSESRGLLQAVVQSGLLRRLSRLVTRCHANQGLPANFAVLADAVLPKVAGLLPADSPAARWGLSCSVKINRNTATKRATLACLTRLMDALEAECGPVDLTTAAADLERLRMAAPGPGCQNPACLNLAGSCEAKMRLRKCAGCKKARYCGAGCQQAAWKLHKHVCAELQAQLA
ncbi:hypothetical protein WJX72_004210 [[Myrmecia] bisecta]|uniref:MYND-type domain-containing protein n=1 Tax=[Myrmecia] bisecta TaxID=41462 RepID=A0AAW1QQ84_9CHLO